MSSKMRRIGLPQLWLLSALAAASPPPPADVESCGSSDAAQCPATGAADDTGFFQLRRSVAATERMGHFAQKSEGAALAAFAEEAAAELSTQFRPPPPEDDDGTLNWWNLPVQRSEEQLVQCVGQLRGKFGLGGAQFGYVPGREGPGLAYECTRVPGLSDKIPEELRGVFWMKGNVMNEELVALQNGKWFPKSRTLITPLSPFSWAWAGVDGTKPVNPPGLGLMYTRRMARASMLQLVANLTSFSLQFSECPGAPWRPMPFQLPGHACTKGSGKPPELTYASVIAHHWGVLKYRNQSAEWTAELYPSTEGNSWNRGIYTTILGKTYSTFSYNMVRILDGDGKPVEPYHSEYMTYIADANLALWYGYTESEVVSVLKQGKLREAWRMMWAGYCGKNPGGEFC